MKGITSLSEMYYYSFNEGVQDAYNPADRRFALCESCFWSATILKPEDNSSRGSSSCPVCTKVCVSLIPLTADEVYALKVRPKGGLEMNFQRQICRKY